MPSHNKWQNKLSDLYQLNNIYIEPMKSKHKQPYTPSTAE